MNKYFFGNRSYSYHSDNWDLTVQNCFWDFNRTNAYEQWIKENVKDKIVCDLGAGNGILCYLAYYYGAKHVYGCEIRKKQFLELTDGFKDLPITIVHCDVLEEEWPEADIYLQEWISSPFIGENIELLFEETIKRELEDRLYPNIISIYNGEGDNNGFRFTKTDDFLEGSKSFIEYFDYEKQSSEKNRRLWSNNVSETSLHWTGHLKDWNNKVLHDMGIVEEKNGKIKGKVFWEMSFDEKYPISNFSQSYSHWQVDRNDSIRYEMLKVG